jgi:uncharacterized protein YndB with AHSA1/START domain
MTTAMEQATLVYQLFIKATPEQIWDAITKPEFTTKYFHGSYVDSSFRPGAPYNGYSTDRSQHWVDGEVGNTRLWCRRVRSRHGSGRLRPDSRDLAG